MVKLIFYGIAALCFSVSAAGKTILDGFGESSKFDRNPALVEISNDGKTLKVDTTKSTGGFHWLFRTRPGILKPNTRYIATFDYRMENAWQTKPAFLLLSRPYSEYSHKRDTRTSVAGPAERFEKVTLRFRTDDSPDPAFQIHTSHRLKGEIKAFILKEDVPNKERFLPITAGAKTYSGSPDSLPTGAKEFEVQLPDCSEGTTVKAADFGFSPDAADNIAALNRAIEFCKKSGAVRLELAPGVYRMTAETSVRLQELRNFELDGKGALLVFHRNKPIPYFQVEHCERIAFRNFNIDWDWEKFPLASIVKVTETAPDHIDLEFVDYKDFPDKDARAALFHCWNPATASLNIENGGSIVAPEFSPNARRLKRQWLSGNRLRLFTEPRGMKPRQYFRMQHYYYESGFMNFVSNRHLTLEDINVYSCSGNAFTIHGAQQYWQFRRVNVAPPKNLKPRPITCTSDHIHLVESCGFMKLEDCELCLGGDDCLNVHDCSAFVLRSGERSVRILAGKSPVEGDEIELRKDDYSPTGFRTRIAAVRSADGIKELVFQDALPAGIGERFVLFNWAYDSHNFIIRNNFFHDNRCRALLLQGRDITVENNRFRNISDCSILIQTGYTYSSWCEGYNISNIVVRNNAFEAGNTYGVTIDGMEWNLHIGSFSGGNIVDHGTYPIISDILFEGNTFTDTFGLTAFISASKNVIFRNNTFVDVTPRQQKRAYRAGFYVTDAENVTIVNNRYLASPLVPNPGVIYDSASVQGLTVGGNRIFKKHDGETKEGSLK